MKDNDSETMEERLGNRLKIAREAAGISVDEAAAQTKIPRAAIEALEAENFGFFTSPLYARSFLKQYAELIDADVQPWVEDFVPSIMVDSEAAETVMDSSVPTTPSRKPEPPSQTSSSASTSILMLLIGTGLVWGGFEIYNNSDHKLSESPPESELSEQEISEPALLEVTPIEVIETDPPASEVIESDEISDIPEMAPDQSQTPSIELKPEPPRRAIIVELPETEEE